MRQQLKISFIRRSEIVRKVIDINFGADNETLADAIYCACEYDGGLFIIDADIYPTFKSEVAHVQFPAVTTMEMNLTSMSGERCLHLSEKVVDGPGMAQSDCLIAVDIANQLKALYKKDKNWTMAKPFEGFYWKNEEDAFNDGFVGQGAKMAS